ncbi:PqiC family protein [Noviherbaspirillum pedocola]|uniref:Membrane integrity-associated transporter subunit PqiC n=1 Tax=Noviherbaspirillum pedocola TaxID=2801341 RepID=A0A934W722_9BURK|nr:PqiC family protein [Noviherbaspirillum pedocola]MBK4736887.1 membrane integrity-associated transporter subunit PqiC [Noviherbaspirillum pedocola]
MKGVNESKGRALRAVAAAVAGVLSAALIAGCGTPGPDHFYTLAPPALASAAPAAAARYTVSVGPVKLPQSVDRPQLVLRESGSQVKILEQHRWAGPLPEEIARSLAASLARQLPDARITTGGNSVPRAGEMSVRLDIERFEASRDNGVTVQGVWTLRQEGVDPVSRQFTASETAGDGSYDAIVAAYSRALAAVGEAVSAEIRKR